MFKIFNLKYAIFFLTLFLVNEVSGQNNLSPQQILERVIKIISDAKGVEAKFTIYNSGYSGSGIIRSQGSKFNVSLPDVEVWYNGKDLYTYNKRTSETTIVIPTPEELAETNPLTYVTSASKSYNVAVSTVKKPNKDVLELTPKNKSEIKRITLTISQKDSKPEKIVVEPSHGNPISAEISSFKTGIELSSSQFEYPKSKYPKVEIVDLR